MDEPLLLEILDEQDIFEVDTEEIRSLCETILDDAGIVSGRLGVVLVDSDTIQLFNKDFLKHDYPTDVISFPMEERTGYLEGEVLACTQIAKERAGEFCWTPREELLLYVVHGVLHLVGFDDITPEGRADMRRKEKDYLADIGITVPELEYCDDWDDSLPDDDGGEGISQTET